jgi:hypothetical protein
MAFENAKKLCMANNLNVEKANPAYGFLRLETNVIDGANTYQFTTTQNTTYNGVNQSRTEVRLALQDNFVVASKGFFIYWINPITQTPITPLLSAFTYFNAGINGTLTPAWNPTLDQPDQINAGALQFWQSSYMRYSIDYNVLIPRWDMLQHYYVPQTQQNFQTIDVGTDAPYPYTANFQQMDGSSDGFVPMEPNIVLSGAKNNEITFYNPLAPSFGDMGWLAPTETDYKQARLVCIYRGILLQNTTNVK